MKSFRAASGAVALRVAVFLSGGVLLGVEIVASRVLAPSFGSSLYVWGSLIGVVLAGLAVGYWAGGALSDRFPTPYLLTGTLALGAVLVLLVPVLDTWVIRQVVAWDPGPRANPLLAAIALFAPVSIVLAAATPIAVRLAAQSLDHLGRTSGRLFSVSTAGSIAGTFATAFWLVPSFGTDQVIALGAVTLFVAATAFAVAQRLRLAAGVLTVAAVAAGIIVTTLSPQTSGFLKASEVQNWSPLYRQQQQLNPGKLSPEAIENQAAGYQVREARDTRYHRMFVLDGDGYRHLRFDSTFQSAMKLNDPYATVFEYTDYLQLGLAYAPSTKRVLFIGLGGGSAVKRMWRDFPSLQLHAVELDPEVVRVAERWFELPTDARITVTAEDGRQFLQKTSERWDMIVIDAYVADSIPFHLATAQFFDLVRSRLSPGGVVVSNVIGATAGDDSKLLRSMAKTYRAVFPTVTVHPVGGGGGYGNVIVVASEGGRPTQAVLVENWARLSRGSSKAVDLREAIHARWEQPLEFGDVPLLTDGYAPTDALLVG